MVRVVTSFKTDAGSKCPRKFKQLPVVPHMVAPANMALQRWPASAIGYSRQWVPVKPIGRHNKWIYMMATPGELIETVAVAFQTPSSRIFAVHRYLREAGLITTGGRGTSAAKMTVRDAAQLLIAACAAGQVKDSADVIRNQGLFVVQRDSWKLPFFPVPELQELKTQHSTIDALGALISSAVSGNLENAYYAIAGNGSELISDSSPPIEILVKISGPVPSARISIARVEYDDDGEPSYVDGCVENLKYFAHAPKSGTFPQFATLTAAQIRSDHSFEGAFTHRSIMHVANLLRG